MNKGLVMKKSRYSVQLRSLSLAVAACFLLQQVATASPSVGPISFGLSSKPKINFSLPESVAAIGDAYHRAGNQKTVILMQDAHTNESGQLNLAKALNIILEKEKISHVFTEAGHGDNSLSYVKDHVSEKTREAVSLSFIRKGLLQGSEYLNITGHHDFVLWGVEDKGLYQKAIETYKTIADERDKVLTYLAKVDKTIYALKERTFNEDLLGFDKKHQTYLKEEISLTDYFEVLNQKAKELNIPLKKFKHLKHLHHLKNLEASIDFNKANHEQAEALKSLPQGMQEVLLKLAKSEDHSPLKLTSQKHQTRKGYYALLEEQLAGDIAGEYPELFKYFEYLKSAKKIDAEGILKEQKDLETLVFKALAKHEDERLLVLYARNLRYLKNLFELKITPEEYEAYQKDAVHFDIRVITGFLNKKIMELEKYYERAIFFSTRAPGASSAAT